MFLKIFIAIATIPVAIAGNYYISAHKDKLIDENGYFFIVKAQESKALPTALSKTKKDEEKLYEDGTNKKNFRCDIPENKTVHAYDTECEIYEIESDAGTTAAKIIDLVAIKKASKITTKSQIKVGNFYVVWINKYLYKSINNLSEINVVNLEEFPKKQEFANLRVEIPLDGKLGEFTLKESFKSKLLLVKLTAKDVGFSWNDSLKCEVNKIVLSCDAWKLTDVSETTEFTSLPIKGATVVSSVGTLTKDQYYIIDIDTRQQPLKASDVISFSNKEGNPTTANTFKVVAGILGDFSEPTKATASGSSSSSSSGTTTTTTTEKKGQFVVVSSAKTASI